MQLEWRLYCSAGWVSNLIRWRSSGAMGDYTHTDVLDPDTGWLWGAHSDAMTIPISSVPKRYNLVLSRKGVYIPAGFYPRPPNYQSSKWRRVTAFTLPVSVQQCESFWTFTEAQWAKPYDPRGLVDQYVLGRDWRDPDAWYCSEEQAAAAESARIIHKLDNYKVDPSDWALILNEAGAVERELPIPVPLAA